MFLKKLLLVGSIAFIACFLTGKYFDGKYRKNWSTLFFNSTDTILDSSKRYDIVLLGNSRIQFGLNPYYIDSATGMNSYNFGIGGSDAALLELNSLLYLKNHPAPGYAVIGADVSLIVPPEAIYTQYHLFYYLENDIIFNQLKKYHQALVLVKYIPFTKYGFFNDYNRRSLFKDEIIYKKFGQNIYKGFLNPHQFETIAGNNNFKTDTITKPFSESGISVVRNVISQLKKAGTKVIIVSPPIKKNISLNKKHLFEKADSVFNTISKEYAIEFLKPGSMPDFDDKYFVDDLHLNEPGTRIFSTFIGTYIKNAHLKK